MTATDVLQKCTVQNRIVKLPNEQLDREIYLEVKKKLEMIGGKWKGGSVYGFVFNEDPSKLLEEIASGENRNLKKEFQFFHTPDKLADKLVALAEPKAHHDISEPSAGQGHIVRAINRYIERHQPALAYPIIDCYELMPLNRTFLHKIPNANILGGDFLQMPFTNKFRKYDRIIANPPFSNNQDIDHILKMYECLKPGGIISTIASKHWEISSNKRERGFKDWVYGTGAYMEDIEPGEFKEAGTMISAKILVITKDE